MEDFSVECLDEFEIEWEYEFDAALFYDFCRAESPYEAEEAQRWFETWGNYPPSPLIGKLNLDLGKDTIAKYSRGPSRLREEQSAKSSSNSSNIHIGSAVSPYKPKTRETLSIGRMAKESPNVMLKSEPRSSNARVSTLMKPTGSHLAKLRSLKPPSKTNERSSWNSSVSYNAAPKRQKLESGYLRKVTVPRDPQLETMQRAQRRSFRSKNDSESSDHAKDKGHPSKSQPLNTKVDSKSSCITYSSEDHNLSKSQNAESAAHSTSVAFKRLAQAVQGIQNCLQHPRPNTQNAAKQGNSVTLLKSKALRCNKIFPSEDTRICENIRERTTISMDSKSTVDKKLPVHPPVQLFNKKCMRKPNECGPNGAHHELDASPA